MCECIIKKPKKILTIYNLSGILKTTYEITFYENLNARRKKSMYIGDIIISAWDIHKMKGEKRR